MKKLSAFILLLGLAFVVSVPLRAYVTGKSISADGNIVEHKWRNFPITWQMNPTQGSNVTGARPQQEVFNSSLQAWQSVGTASVSVVQGANTAGGTKAAYDGINVITTNPSAGSLPAGVLAVTYTYFFDQGGPGFVDPLGRPIEAPGQIMEADMVFNSTVPFTTELAPVTGRFDLQAVATHESGHIFGLDHASNVSSTMFWAVGPAIIYPRNLSSDDMTGISALYPTPAFAIKGKISGTVRTMANTPVYGAIVVAVNSSGTPVASTVTDPNGAYLIEGLDEDTYSVFAEPLAGRISPNNISTLNRIYPDQTVNSNFTTRYR